MIRIPIPIPIPILIPIPIPISTGLACAALQERISKFSDAIGQLTLSVAGNGASEGA